MLRSCNQMKNAARATGLAAVLCAAFLTAAPDANAQSGETPAATLASLQSNIALLTNRNPGLADVRVLLAGDCRERFGQVAEPRQTMFCQCASTVTISLWLQSADQMVPLLQDYLSMPTPEKLNAFLGFQGPELYRPFCEAAVED